MPDDHGTRPGDDRAPERGDSESARNDGHRLTLWLAFAAAVALVGVGVIVGTRVVSSDNRDANASPSQSSGPRSSPDTKATGPVAPPSKGGLEVVDKGVGRISGGYSYGIILKNTSHLAVKSAQVTVTPLDSTGNRISEEGSHADNTSVIMPGAQFGVGDFFSAAGGAVSDVRVKIHNVSWWPVRNSVRPFAKVTVTEVDMSSRSTSDDMNVILHVRSGYGQHGPDIPTTYVIFRGADGKIVGGGQLWNPSKSPDGSSGTYVYSYPNGLVPYRSSAELAEAYITM